MGFIMIESLMLVTGPRGDKVAGLTGQWTSTLTTFPTFGTNPCWCQVGQYIYILGGTATTTAGLFYRLDLVSRTFTQLSTPARPSNSAEMQYYDGVLYVFDGYGQTAAAGYVWMYNIATNTWTYNSTFNSYGARGRGRSFVEGGRLYNIGGIGPPPGNGVYFSDEIYYTATNTRTESGRIISDWSGFAGKGVLIGAKFYYTRAYNAVSEAMYCYDIASRTITKLAANPFVSATVSASGGIGLCSVNGYLAQRNNNEVHFYDPVSDTWSQLKPIGTNVPTFKNGNNGNIWAFYGDAIYNYDVTVTATASKLLWKMT